MIVPDTTHFRRGEEMVEKSINSPFICSLFCCMQATFATHQNEIAFPDAEKKKRVTKTHMAGVRDMELSGILATQRAKQLHRFALAVRTRPTRLVDGLHLLAKSTPFERRQSTDKLDGEF
ncbi:uncharacterized protein CIMG_11246 [Coccidioides immitis RS]|uniref:Uncharacterized protein n=1 Tax=Coccidioides immitis (strain RS) TaxID=246410 RepID=A0A0D8JW97_COCIM|nr:uncharacterized protein CIMG_11246 [Coccidioides immitis RS]KJF61592.1 hypothetical protein CIMG_11246 [Coccidioides immitis RS]